MLRRQVVGDAHGGGDLLVRQREVNKKYIINWI